MTTIPEYQIKIKVRDLIIFVIGIISIVGSFIWGISRFTAGMTELRTEINALRNERIQDKRFDEMRFTTLERTVEALQAQVDNLRNGQNVNRQNIDNLSK